MDCPFIVCGRFRFRLAHLLTSICLTHLTSNKGSNLTPGITRPDTIRQPFTLADAMYADSGRVHAVVMLPLWTALLQELLLGYNPPVSSSNILSESYP
jgi:hypothetical protein